MSNIGVELSFMVDALLTASRISAQGFESIFFEAGNQRPPMQSVRLQSDTIATSRQHLSRIGRRPNSASGGNRNLSFKAVSKVGNRCRFVRRALTVVGTKRGRGEIRTGRLRAKQDTQLARVSARLERSNQTIQQKEHMRYEYLSLQCLHPAGPAIGRTRHSK